MRKLGYLPPSGHEWSLTGLLVSTIVSVQKHKSYIHSHELPEPRILFNFSSILFFTQSLVNISM